LTYKVKRRYSELVIRTFRCRKTERLFRREHVREFANIALVALRRLTALNNAVEITDLQIPPSNHLEPLSRDREGQHSIRINQQYRICFTWREDGPHDVEITNHYR
jgi:proteic killer suppression protein